MKLFSLYYTRDPLRGTDACYLTLTMYEDTSDHDNSYFFLIYVPGAGDSHSTGFGQRSGLFGPTIHLDLEQTRNSGSLYWVQASANRTPSLRITVDGRKIQCDVTTVDFNPAPNHALYSTILQHEAASEK